MPAVLCGGWARGKGGRDSQPKGLWGRWAGQAPVGFTKHHRQGSLPRAPQAHANHPTTPNTHAQYHPPKFHQNRHAPSRIVYYRSDVENIRARDHILATAQRLGITLD